MLREGYLGQARALTLKRRAASQTLRGPSGQGNPNREDLASAFLTCALSWIGYARSRGQAKAEGGSLFLRA